MGSRIKLFDHQKLAVEQLRSGSILTGGVGSGKTLTALAYYYTKECGGVFDDVEGIKEMTSPKDLYIITTAKKRDTLDWEHECTSFLISKDRSASINGVMLTVDSWNNIGKYEKVTNAFFIFDEQRVVGSGSWVKSFLKIVKNNNWIMLSATPGDTWMDYIPAFIANGFYRSRQDFILQHVFFNGFTKYPKVDHYVEESKLIRLKKQILVEMPFARHTVPHHIVVPVPYDKEMYDLAAIKRWNPYTDMPIKDVSELCGTLRKIVNSDPSRLYSLLNIIDRHQRVIIFYSYDYELEILRRLREIKDLGYAEYNGHFHESIPDTHRWVYVVNYLSGAEGWNCVETNTIAFYSQTYSYRMKTQSEGRIDRLNTTFVNLYYYHIRSLSSIDNAILKALTNKKNFNENKFLEGEFNA